MIFLESELKGPLGRLARERNIILSRIPMMGSVTNNSTTKVRIGYRIYSLWRFIITHRLQLLTTDKTHN
jgi:hypothetical protein